MRCVTLIATKQCKQKNLLNIVTVAVLAESCYDQRVQFTQSKDSDLTLNCLHEIIIEWHKILICENQIEYKVRAKLN